MTLATALNIVTQDRAATLSRDAYRADLTEAEVMQDVALVAATDRAFPEAAQAVIEAKRTMAAHGILA